MARKNRQAYANASGVFGVQQQPADKKEADQVPDQACGMCVHFSESAYSGDGRGTCKKLKEGSDLHSSPPAFVLEGKNGYLVRALTDAGQCTYFEKMKFVDKDGYECSDPQFRRSLRQFQDK